MGSGCIGLTGFNPNPIEANGLLGWVYIHTQPSTQNSYWVRVIPEPNKSPQAAAAALAVAAREQAGGKEGPPAAVPAAGDGGSSRSTEREK